MIKDYYTLVKPGIIYGNAFTLIAGFMLASHGGVDWMLLAATLIGISFVIASGCVFNNYIDRDIDALMERTKKRALVRGVISVRNTLIYATVLGLSGLGILLFFTNVVAASIALVGFFVYVVLYSIYLKRSSVHGVLIGGVSGAVPPLVGYVAVRGSIDLGGVLLFLILMMWQMPHSFAIALYRLRDYTAASIPVLPRKKGVHATKVQMLVYVVFFMISAALLSVFDYTGQFYLIVMMFLGLWWLWLCLQGFRIDSSLEGLWARRVFSFSIIILVVFCVIIIAERLIH